MSSDQGLAMAGQMLHQSLMWVWALHQQLQRKAKLWIAQMYHCPPSDSTPGSAAGAHFPQHNHVLLMERAWVLQTGLSECCCYTQKPWGRRDEVPGELSSFTVTLIWNEHGEKEKVLVCLWFLHPSIPPLLRRESETPNVLWVSADACRHNVFCTGAIPSVGTWHMCIASKMICVEAVKFALHKIGDFI